MKKKINASPYRIALQSATPFRFIPSKSEFHTWVTATLQKRLACAELTIRLVDEKESAMLNEKYRHKTGPTNILSFSCEAPEITKNNLLGDLVICAPLVAQEAQQQQKTILAHWAHLVVHGTLHLLGYDHQHASDADKMESAEIHILQQLGFTNPYIDRQ